MAYLALDVSRATGQDSADAQAISTGFRADLQHANRLFHTLMAMVPGSDTAGWQDLAADVLFDRYFAIRAEDGGNGDDTLVGDDNSNLLSGLLGNDSLEGRGGDDFLYGGDGIDTLLGGEGADLLDGGAGTADLASYADSPGGLRADLLHSYSNTGAAAGDTFTGIENLLGSAFADILGGDHSANRLEAQNGDDAIDGRGGNDIIFGGAGVDTLLGNAGNDTLIGGAGGDLLHGGADARDLASYQDSATALRADLRYGYSNTGDAAGDVYMEIEGLEGTSFADILGGDTNRNLLYGMDGNDSLDGRGGFDTLYGGNGNDVLVGGSEGDVLDGGAGTMDVASYWNAPAGLRADFIYTLSSTGDASGDSYVGIEGLQGSLFADVLGGDHFANLLDGLDGNDGIDGRLGNDTLDGGNGNDNLAGNEGQDVLTGGAGNDLLYGGEGNDLLNGGNGNDTLEGNGGQDVLTGGLGADVFWFGMPLPWDRQTDQITDYVVADDMFRLPGSMFGYSVRTGPLAESSFHLGPDANSSEHRVMYDSFTGNLFIDADGTGNVEHVLIAQLSPGLMMTAAEFFVF